jgi:hypothetical protein
VAASGLKTHPLVFAKGCAMNPQSATFPCDVGVKIEQLKWK